jgi:O-antigen/teichoic acid export membrane protein
LGFTVVALCFFLAHVLIARQLGVSGFGEFSFILALVSVFRFVVDMGLRNILIREIARDRDRVGELLGSARAILWILSLLTLVALTALIHVVSTSEHIIQATYVAALAIVVAFQGLNYGAVCRAFEDMGLDILGSVLQACSFLAFVLVGIQQGLDLTKAFLALFAANLLAWLYYYLIVRLRYVRGRIRANLQVCLFLFSESFVLGLSEITRKLVWQVDRLLLTWLSGTVAVGLFSAAYRLVETVNPIVMNLTISLFPAFSRMAATSKERLGQAYEKSLKFLSVIGAPAAVVLFVWSEHFVTIVFGPEFAPAAGALRILAAVVLLAFLTSLNLYAFTSLGMQRAYAMVCLCTLLVNIAADWVLVPLYDFNGAAAGTLLAEIFFFAACLTLLRRNGVVFSARRAVWKPVLAGGSLAPVLVLLESASIPWMIAGLLLGLATYVLAMWLLKVFDDSELTLIQKSLGLRAYWNWGRG